MNEETARDLANIANDLFFVLGTFLEVYPAYDEIVTLLRRDMGDEWIHENLDEWRL